MAMFIVSGLWCLYKKWFPEAIFAGVAVIICIIILIIETKTNEN